MLFYLLVAASLVLPRKARVPFIACALFALVLLGLIAHPSGVLTFYTNPIMLEFLLGIVIGVMFRPAKANQRASFALCLSGLVLFVSLGTFETDQNRFLTWGIPLAICAAGAINMSLPHRNVVLLGLGLVGDASYSIYLTQFIVIPPAAMLMAHVLRHMNMLLGSLTFAAGVVGLAVLAGIGTYYLIEKPMLRASSRLLTGKRRTDTRAAVPEW
jgi:exopolysaccharide production protein ExoZ